MARMVKAITPLIFGFIILSLSACGGGGGESAISAITGVTPPVTPPVTGGGPTTGNTATLKGLVSTIASGLGKPGRSKALAAVKTPVQGATVLVFDLDSASTSAVATATTDASGNWETSLDMKQVGKGDGKGSLATFAVWIDKSGSTLKVKVASLDDIAVDVTGGETVKDLSKEGKDMTVEEDKVKPTVLSILDDNSPDTGVSDGDPDPLFEPSNMPNTGKIVIAFSESLEQAALQNGALELYAATVTNRDPVTGKGGTWAKGIKVASTSDANSVVAFSGKRKEFRWTPPDGALQAEKDYILEVKVGVNQGAADSNCLILDAPASCLYVADPAGNKIADNSNKDFPDNDNTAAVARIHTVSTVTFKVDTTKPAAGATGVSILDPISLTFSAPVDFVTLKNNISSSPQLPNGRVEANATTVTFFPVSPLQASTTYTVTVGANTAAISGETLGTALNLTFTTGADLFATVTAGDADKALIVRGVERVMNAFETGDFNTFVSGFAVDFQPAFEDPFSKTINRDYNGDGTVDAADAEAWFEDRKRDMSEQNQHQGGFAEIERVPVKNTAGKHALVEHFKNAIGIELYHGWTPLLPGVDFIEVKKITTQFGSPFDEFVMYEVACNPKFDPTLCVGRTESKVQATWEECEEFVSPEQPGVDNDGDGKYNEDWRDRIDNDGDGKIDEDDWCNKVTADVHVKDGDGDLENKWANDNELGPDKQPLFGNNDNDSQFDEDGTIVVITTGRHSESHADGDTECFGFNFLGQPLPLNDTVCDGGTKVTYKSSIAGATLLAATAGKDFDGIDNDGDAVEVDGSNNHFFTFRVNEDWPDGIDNDFVCSPTTGTCSGDGKVDEDSDGVANDPQPRDSDTDPKNDPMPWDRQNAFWSNSELYLVPVSEGGDPSEGWVSEVGTLSFGKLRGPRGWPNVYRKDWSTCFAKQTDPTKEATFQVDVCKPDTIDFNEDGDFRPETTDTGPDSKPQIRRIPNVPGTVAAKDLNADSVINDLDDFLSVGWDGWRYGVSFDLQIVGGAYIDHPLDHKIIDVEPSWLVMQGDDDNDGKINEDGTLDAFLKGTGSVTLGSCANNVAHTFDQVATAVATGCDFSDGLDNDQDGQVDENDPYDDDFDGDFDEDPVDQKDNDNDGRVDEDPTNPEFDWFQDPGLWEKVFSETTDAVTKIFTVESELTAEYKKVVIGSTFVLLDVNGFPLFTDNDHGFAGVVLTDTRTWSPHNPFCEPFDPVTRKARECTDTETSTFGLKFDFVRTNGGWFVLALAGPPPERIHHEGAGPAPGPGPAPGGGTVVMGKPSLGSSPTGPTRGTILDVVAQSPRYSGRRHAR